MTRKFTILLTAAALALLGASTTFGAPNQQRAPFVDGVWIDGTVHTLSTGPPPAGASHPIPLYVIAPVSASHPLHPLAFAKPLGFGAHDHVAAIPNGKSSYHGLCELTLVVPGSKARLGSNVEARRTLTPAGLKPLLYGARLGNAMEALNWASRIKQAQSRGLAKLVDTKTVVGCAITSRDAS
ncbi:MAG TPA: hypothetical protein VLJ76_12145 [Gaiellaceae bacterium]|nr:hypothetical protein [Gaiellaceae bacterium]